MLRVWTPQNDWPASTWEIVPPDCRYLTVRRAPVPYLLVRERDDEAANAVWARVGVPLQLEPKREYEILNVADPTIDLVTVPAAANAVLTFSNRKTEIVLSERPVPGGSVRLRYRVQNANVAGSTILSPVRRTTRGLRSCTTRVSANGVITEVQQRIFEPESPTIVSVYPFPAVALAATAAYDLCLGWPYLGAGAVQYPHIGSGVSEIFVFPVTTTPIAEVSYTGLPERED